MSNNNVAAVIVTYNYNEMDLKSCIKSIVNQVEEIIIVDNASINQKKIFDIIKEFSESKICCIKNDQNLGIATALNQGIKTASQKEFEWILSLDQDSKCASDFISEMLSTYKSFPKKQREDTAMLVPKWIDLNLTEEKINKKNKVESVPTAITSGALYKSGIFSKVGFFEEKLFIDQVDHEFCLRLKQQNFKIFKIENSLLFHKLGESVERKFLKMKFVVTHHSPVRRYYITRNRIYLANKFKKSFPIIFRESIIKIIKDSVIIIFFEEQKYKKIKMTFYGVHDAYRQNFGEFVKR